MSTDIAHEACYDVSKALAHVGMRVLTDAQFLARVRSLCSFVRRVQGVMLDGIFVQVKAAFEANKKKRGD